MEETRRGRFFRAQAAANRRIALEHERCPPLLAEHGGGDESVDSATDEHIVVSAHASFSRASFILVAFASWLKGQGTIASARTGEPVPLTNLSGAAIRIAPLGGSWSRLQRLARP